MNLNTVYDLLKEWRINSEEALEYLAVSGCKPGVFRDGGKWAVSLYGGSVTDSIDFTQSVNFLIETKDWQINLRDALLHILKKEHDKKVKSDAYSKRDDD